MAYGIESGKAPDLLESCRAILTASVRGAFSDEAIKTAALKTSFPASSTVSAALSAAVAAGSAGPGASSPSAAANSIHLAISAVYSSENNYASSLRYLLHDNDISETSTRALLIAVEVTNLDVKNLVSEPVVKLFGHKLWLQVKAPSGLVNGLEILTKFWSSDLQTWGFWKIWYDDLFNGMEANWELWRDIALFPDADWMLGAAHIAGKINEAKARQLGEKLPIAESVEFNQKSGKFSFLPQIILNPSLLGATLSQAEDALDDALADSRNGLQENSRETRVLRRTFVRYGNDPQRIEMDFTAIHAGLVRQIATDDLPASEVNLGLIRALEEGALGIRTAHPDVAQNRKLIEMQAFVEMPRATLDKLAEALPILVDITEGLGQVDWQQDISAIVEASNLTSPLYRRLGPAERNSALAARDEKVRVFGRSARILVSIKATPRLIHVIDKTATYKGARIMTTLYTLVDIGLKLFRLF